MTEKIRLALLFATLFVAGLFLCFLFRGTIEPFVNSLLVAAACGGGGCAVYCGCRSGKDDPDDE